MKRIRISSSIANFSAKLRARYSDYGDFKWFSKDPTIFFGIYHTGDFARYVLHRGEKTAFMCGSDILSLPRWFVPFLGRGTIYCENEVEQVKLAELGLKSYVHPMIFDDPSKYTETYEPSDTPTVWMSYHLGREEEYGLYRFLSVARQVPGLRFRFFNGQTPIEDFDEVTSHHQATIRFNEFDGFSENAAKALLRGQYVYSVVPYHGVETITTDDKLVEALKALKDKKEPNPVSPYWREHLSKRVEV